MQWTNSPCFSRAMAVANCCSELDHCTSLQEGGVVENSQHSDPQRIYSMALNTTRRSSGRHSSNGIHHHWWCSQFYDWNTIFCCWVGWMVQVAQGHTQIYPGRDPSARPTAEALVQSDWLKWGHGVWRWLQIFTTSTPRGKSGARGNILGTFGFIGPFHSKLTQDFVLRVLSTKDRVIAHTCSEQLGRIPIEHGTCHNSLASRSKREWPCFLVKHTVVVIHVIQ